jgi:hypothetical protein
MSKTPPRTTATTKPAKPGFERDTHVYLHADDVANLEKVKALMIALGFPGNSINQQDVIRFALRRAAGN